MSIINSSVCKHASKCRQLLMQIGYASRKRNKNISELGSASSQCDLKRQRLGFYHWLSLSPFNAKHTLTNTVLPASSSQPQRTGPPWPLKVQLPAAGGQHLQFQPLDIIDSIRIGSVGKRGLRPSTAQEVSRIHFKKNKEQCRLIYRNYRNKNQLTDILKLILDLL